MGNVLTDTSDGTGFPAWVGATWSKATVLRYGENPHQKAALYTHGRPGVATAERLHGKEMSYNNYVDADAAQRAAYDHAEPAVAIVKHANPCGIAVGADVAQAYQRAHACDPQSAFGGVVATNRPVTAAMAEQVAAVFTEVVVAPDYELEALEILRRKKAVRLLRLPEGIERPAEIEFRAVSGGILIQTRDRIDAVVEGDEHGGPVVGPAATTVAVDARLRGAGRPRTDGRPGVRLAGRPRRQVQRHPAGQDGASVGVGMGQVNRVDSCHLAVTRAGADRAAGSVAASDAFFPFADGLQVLLDAGVRAVVAPGGSMRDPRSSKPPGQPGSPCISPEPATSRTETRLSAEPGKAWVSWRRSLVMRGSTQLRRVGRPRRQLISALTQRSRAHRADGTADGIGDHVADRDQMRGGQADLLTSGQTVQRGLRDSPGAGVVR
jgi:phosphoribosylaminoimidazolecarboxamide formyltransferase/IMP cyclohydrolase